MSAAVKEVPHRSDVPPYVATASDVGQVLMLALFEPTIDPPFTSLIELSRMLPLTPVSCRLSIYTVTPRIVDPAGIENPKLVAFK